jgi:hypothetical protein
MNPAIHELSIPLQIYQSTSSKGEKALQTARPKVGPESQGGARWIETSPRNITAAVLRHWAWPAALGSGGP